MHWRRIPLALLLTLPALAGCLGDGDPDPIEHVPDETDMDVAQPFSLFLCDDGYHLADDIGSDVDLCNHRVTKPLQDGSWFNVVDQHGPANEVSVAVNPTDPLNAAGGGKDYSVSYVSDDARCGDYTVWMGTYWTHDGGLTWGNDLMPGFNGDPRESPLHGQYCNTDPVLVYDDDGTLYYNSLNYIGARSTDSLGISNPLYPGSQNDMLTGSQIYFAKSTDGGATYGDFSFAVEGDADSIFHDKQWFALQPGGDHVIATWSLFTGTPPAPEIVPDVIADTASYGNDVVMYVESFDGGETWGPMTAFTPGTAFTASMQFSMPQYLPGGDSLAVIWAEFLRQDEREGVGLQEEAVLAYTEAPVGTGGAPTVFEPAQQAFTFHPLKSMPGRDGTGPTKFRLSTYPVLAIDTSGGEFDGRRYVTWADQPGTVDTDTQVLMRYSDDGVSWSGPITINDVDAGDQFMPWIDVDPEGGVHVVWYDRRNDDTNREMDVYYAYSDDGGETFHPNIRVTETLFDGDLGHHQRGFPFIGDYIAVDASAEAAYIMWADTRHTGVEGMGREAGSDVYSATILKDAAARDVFDAAFGEG